MKNNIIEVVFILDRSGSMAGLEADIESTSFEDAIRNAISIGGDSDTIAAITGAVAEAYYGMTEVEREKAISYLDGRLSDIAAAFREACRKRQLPKG